MLLLSVLTVNATELKNDSCRCDGTEENLSIAIGFVAGECFASVFEPAATDYPFVPDTISVILGPSHFETLLTVFLYEVDENNQPTTQIGGDAVAFTPNENALQSVDLYTLLGYQDAPAVEEGNIAVVMCFEEDYDETFAPAYDVDGNDHTDRNWIQTAGNQWHTSDSLRVDGDWVMRLSWGEGDADTDTDSDSDADADSDTDTDTDTDTDAGELRLYAISPNTAAKGEAVDLLIEGDGFVTGAEVHIGGLNLTGTEVIDATRISGRSPQALEPGDYDVDVVNPDGTSEVLAEAFTVSGGCGCATGGGAGGVVAGLLGLVALVRRRGVR